MRLFGNCPRCGERIALTEKGVVPRHDHDGAKCPGSYQPPKQENDR